MKKCALFSTNFIASSQAFIYQELKSIKSFAVDVFAKSRMNEDRFPYDRVFSHFPAKSLREKAAGFVYEYFLYSKKFIKIFEKENYDAVHAQFGPGGIYAMFYANRFHLPLIVTFCGYDVPVLDTYRRFLPQFLRYWLLSKKLFGRITLVLAVSQYLADRLIAMGVDKDKVRVFHRGIAIPKDISFRQRSADEPLKLIMAGRLVDKKGFEYGIEALHIAKERGYTNIRCELVGQGPLYSRLLSLIQKYALEDMFCLTVDLLPQVELFKHYASSHVVIVPSVTAKNGDVEGLPNVIKEGCAHGCAALVSSHSGCPDAVDDGISGFIVPERDAQALADKIMYFYDHPEETRQMGERAYQKMCDEFDIEKTHLRLEQLYEEAIQRYKNQSDR